MNATGNRTPREIFVAALRLAPDQWDDFLRSECDDDSALQDRVRELLRAHAGAGSFLDGPAVPTIATTPAEAPGTIIGPYKLLEQIGEGGMGLVFMAEQTEPIRRKVALKIIKPGMDTRQVVARFEAERQALALMDHPNIAKILDAGTIEHAAQASDELITLACAACSRPYFVMELVRGIPITEFCDAHRYTPKQRLALFVTVCQAVQHAHQKGIIHRDLKPSNILVTLHDAQAVPKIIDFGIAKATHQPLTDRTMFTNFAQMIGTPTYMSPEQAEMNSLDVDTRSDIYSLGVLLYELLTGTTPFDSQKLKEAGFDEMRRLIREQDPPRPSQRISTLEVQALTTLTERRGVNGRRFGQTLRGELDWIVMKALEKDRNRRYDSASALAEDVQRYLDDEPIQAKPPGWRQKAAKWGRRHRGVIGASVAILMFAVVALGISIWFISNERDTARREKQAADERLAFARQVVKTMYIQIAEKWLDDEPQLENFQLETLRSAAGFFEQFANEAAINPQMRMEQAIALWNLAEVYLKLERSDEALRYAQQSVDVLNSLRAEQPTDVNCLAALARTHHTCGRCLKLSGKRGEAEPHFREALHIRRSLVQAHPSEQKYRLALAASLGALADSLPKNVVTARESEQLFRDAIEIEEALLTESDSEDARNNLAATLNNLALLLQRQGRLPESRDAVKRAIEMGEVNIKRNPRKRIYREHLANQFHNLGITEFRLENYSSVEDSLKSALALRERLAEDFPNVPIYRRQLVESKIGVGSILARNGKEQDAEKTHKEALAAITELAGRFPTKEHRRILDLSHSELSECYREAGHFSLAEQHQRESLAIQRAELAADNATPETDSRFHHLSGGLHNLAMILFAQDRYADAIESQREAIRIQEAVVRAHGATNVVFRRFLCNQKAGLSHYLTDSPEPLRDLGGALNAAKGALALDPKYDSAILSLGRAQFRSGDDVAAIGTLEPMQVSKDSAGVRREITKCFLLAMCYCHLGDATRSLFWFAAGDQLLRNDKQKPHQRRRLDDLRTEAAHMLGIDWNEPKPTARAPDGP